VIAQLRIGNDAEGDHAHADLPRPAH
jgi:hypothetical protein